MPDQTTATGPGYRVNLLIARGVPALVVIALAAGIAWATPLSGTGSLALAFAAIGFPCFLVFLVRWLYRRRAGGAVVLDCGYRPDKEHFFGQAALLLFIGIPGALGLGLPEPIGFRICWFAVFVSMAFIYLVQATGRLHVREAGLWLYCELIRWNQIERYGWEKDSTLLVKTKGPLSYLRPWGTRIPPEHHRAVGELLRKHCSLEPSL